MTKNEKNLFLKLCCFKNDEASEIGTLLEKNATAPLLGELFFNRMQGVAYGVLKEYGLLGSVNREFRNALHSAHLQNVQKNKSFTVCLQLVANILKPTGCRYAMLKGAVLCGYYPEGYRTANDIDLLISPEDVTTVGNALCKAGFRQGHIRSGQFTPATRQEIIASKMMRGETIPYILQVNLPFMPFLEVDINFSLDFKNNSDNNVERMLEHTELRWADNVEIRTLNKADFFIHLCLHLYKEATTMPWVEMRRDLTLYKFTDIYVLLQEMTAEEVYNLFIRAANLQIAAICSCVILWTQELLPFDNVYAIEKAREHIVGKEELLGLVIAPAEKKRYTYSAPLRTRFFAVNRVRLLKEIQV